MNKRNYHFRITGRRPALKEHIFAVSSHKTVMYVDHTDILFVLQNQKQGKYMIIPGNYWANLFYFAGKLCPQAE